MGLFTYDPLTLGGFDLSDTGQLKIFQSQLAQYLNQMQYTITQLVKNPSYAVSALNFKTAYFPGVVANQAIDCVGAAAVGVGLSVNTNFGPLLTLQHLAPAIPVMVTFTNAFSGPVTLGISATTPAGAAYSAVYWKLSTGLVNMTTTGTAVGAGVTVIAAGSTAPLISETLFMVAN